MECSTCNVPWHLPRQFEQMPILITSSALNDWHAQYKRTGRYAGDALHLETIAVPGVKLKDLIRVYYAELANYVGLIDVFVVAGLNDVDQGRTVLAMLNDVMTFRQMVLNRHAMMYFPPKMVRL